MLAWVAVAFSGALPATAGAQTPDLPAAVQFQNRTIATLRATLGPSTPAARAQAAMRRLAEAGPADFRGPVRVIPYTDARNVFLGDRMILGLVPSDAEPGTGETVDQLAAVAAENLRVAVRSWTEQRRPGAIVGGVIRVLFATVVVIAALMLLAAARRRIARSLSPLAARAVEHRYLALFGRDLRSVALRTLAWTINAAAVLASFVLAYSWLAYSLVQFPLTAPWGEGLAGFLGEKLRMIGSGMLHGIPGLVVAAMILAVTRFVARIMANLFNAVEQGQVKMRGVHPDTADATRRIVTVVIWVFGIAFAYPFIPGASSDAFKGLSVLVGVMLSLGSSGVINQAMSGMVVVFSRALKVGEYVRIGDDEGVVLEVGALSTKLRTKRNEEVNIPNSTLVTSPTTNYSRLAGEQGLIVSASIGVGYGAAWRVIHQLLVDAAARTPGVRRDPAPFVRQSALTSFCVDYAINAYLERPEQRHEVLSDLHANIQDAFNDAEIQIMTPAFEGQPASPILGPKSP